MPTGSRASDVRKSIAAEKAFEQLARQQAGGRMSALITDYQIVDHGIEQAKFFQGCGTFHARFEHCVTGKGQDAAEAWDDALEKIAQPGNYDITPLKNSEHAKTYTSDKARAASVEAYCKGEVPEECELYYYLSIRFSTSGARQARGAEYAERKTNG